MHNRSICFPHFNSNQMSEAAYCHATDLSLMHLQDTDNWLSNTTRPIEANYRPTNGWLRASADAITSQVDGRYRHVGGIFSLEWTSRCLVLGVQNRILEVLRTPLIVNFSVRRRFQNVIYAVRRLNGSPVGYYRTKGIIGQMNKIEYCRGRLWESLKIIYIGHQPFIFYALSSLQSNSWIINWQTQLNFG